MDKKYALLILFLLGITMLIPVNYSYATIKETTLTLDPVHKDYRVGEEIIFTGKLVDSEKYMLSNEEIKIMPSSTLSRTIGNDLTDARGNFRIVVPAELWNGDGGNVSFIAYYDGSDKFKESKSNVIVSEMRKLYTPLGKEFEYETLKEQGYFKQKSAPDNSVNPQPKIPTQTNDVNVPSSKDCPDGAYHGVDNQGNEVCRDIKTNAVLSVLEKNQKTGNVSSKDTERTGCANPFASGCLSSTNLEIILFIVVIITIITSIIIVKNKNKMTFGCRHNFEYSRGQFSCSKCGVSAKKNQFKRNHNKSYATIVIIGLVIISGIYVYGNYHNVIMGSIPAINNEPDPYNGIDYLVKIPDNISKTISDNIPEKIIDNTKKAIGEITIPEVNLSETELQKKAVDWNYNDILRNIENYQGKIIHIVGQIHRTEEISGDRFGFLVLTNPDTIMEKHNYIMVEHTGKRFLDDDRIEAWGTVERTSILPTLFGAEQLMPVIKSIKINCLSCP